MTHKLSKSEEILDPDDKRITFKYLYKEIELLKLKNKITYRYIDMNSVKPGIVTVRKKRVHELLKAGSLPIRKANSVPLKTRLEEAQADTSKDYLDVSSNEVTNDELDQLIDDGYKILDHTSTLLKWIQPIIQCFGSTITRRLGIRW